uniref:Uncharacterized protein n=1 Tax=Leersia perrieri TaxID=77586 RepID=A0A0D9WXB5_9ORYZ
MVTFTASRSKPELILPARPTPCEVKMLSDLDDQYAHWHYVPLVEFFRLRRGVNAESQDPARAVRAGLAEALVYYYPMAGRLQEVPGGKLAVDCAAQGVVFIKATADDVRLEDFGEPLVPPYPCVEELFCEVGDAAGRAIIGKPLVYVQVTKFKCGGFAIGFHLNHCISDGFGMIQFVRAIIDLARGEARPVVLPVWEREVLMARNPPSIELAYQKFKPLLKSPAAAIDHDVMLSTPLEDMVSRHFLFGWRELTALRSLLPAQLAASTSNFELLTAVSWRCRTAALGYGPTDMVRLCFPSNGHGRHGGVGAFVPPGYYGNTQLYPVAVATAGELCHGGTLSLCHAVELVRQGKGMVSEEYMRSVVDLMSLLRGRSMTLERVYLVSGITKLGEDEFDFGWAERAGGGISVPTFASFHMKCKGASGDPLVAVSMLLPRFAMDKFTVELAFFLNGAKRDKVVINSSM